MPKRIALIGGTSGIGAAAVDKLLAQGDELFIACRRPELFAARGIESQTALMVWSISLAALP
jgi:NAD(P)-dependent dehydrogenase (short-subunit alcohol dehydrogenase family)